MSYIESCLYYNSMKPIIAETIAHFINRPLAENTQGNLIKHIKWHPLYCNDLQPLFSSQTIKDIKAKIKQNKNSSKSVSVGIEQLSLYLKRDTNKLLFEIYELILKHPSGLTYKDIEKKTNHRLEIVNISHYCCRLRKMNFIDIRHDKSEKVVYPKCCRQQKLPIKRNEEEDEEDHQFLNKKQNIQNSEKFFFFGELSIFDNVWLNVSGADSYYNKGITNEEIKQRIHKPADSKLVMKIMDNAKDIYKFKREMVSEGKIFEHRYHNVPTVLLQAINKNNEAQLKAIQFPAQEGGEDRPEQLADHIEEFLTQKFPQFAGKNLLFDLINAELRSYHTAVGKKSARRTCTPIKLARYIKILNSLDQTYPQDHIELKRLIIDEEKQSQNGIMHKRSIIGILQGLVQQDILRQEQQLYFPMWQARGSRVDPSKKEDIGKNKLEMTQPKKKIKLSRLSQEEKNNEGHKIDIEYETISLQQYQTELRVKLLAADLEILVKNKLKKAFRAIFFVKRIKTFIKYYQPEPNVVHLLEDPLFEYPEVLVKQYQEYLNQIDYHITQCSKKEEFQLRQVNYDVIKLFRKFPERTEQQLKKKFGNNWREKLDPMITKGYLVEENNIVKNPDSSKLLI